MKKQKEEISTKVGIVSEETNATEAEIEWFNFCEFKSEYSELIINTPVYNNYLILH